MQDTQLKVLEELALVEELQAVGAQIATRLVISDYDADIVDGADGNRGGGESQPVAVLAESLKEGVVPPLTVSAANPQRICRRRSL